MISPGMIMSCSHQVLRPTSVSSSEEFGSCVRHSLLDGRFLHTFTTLAAIFCVLSVLVDLGYTIGIKKICVISDYRSGVLGSFGGFDEAVISSSQKKGCILGCFVGANFGLNLPLPFVWFVASILKMRFTFYLIAQNIHQLETTSFNKIANRIPY